MPSQAEVDLVISTADALPELQRNLNRIVRTAEDGTPELDIDVGIRTEDTLNQLQRDLTRVIARAEADPDNTLDITALINQRRSLQQLQTQVRGVVRSAQQGAPPISVLADLNRVDSFRQVADGLRTVVRQAQRAAPDVDVRVRTDEDSLRRVTQGLRNLGSRLGDAAGTAARFGVAAGGMGIAAGAAVPAIASLAAAAAKVAPAAGIAVSAMVAMKLAAGTLQLAMVGVEEAVEAAFDPDAKPEDLEKALKRLAPEARSFVRELRDMRSQLRSVQQGVQNRVFQDLDESLAKLGRTTLPVVRTALFRTAGVLNEMARGAADAASELATDGTLGKALDGATKGLENLRRVPAQVVTGLGQIAAAASPAFDKLTRRIDTASTKIAERLAKAFESGDLEAQIDTALSTIGQLFDSLGNVGAGIKNIFGGLTESGRGLFDILETITQAFEDLTASKEFQSILSELAQTADTLLAALLPLIEEAFKQLGPVIEELAPVVREFIAAIGPELIPVIQELGPILKDIALILKDQLPLAIEITKAAIGVLVLALQGVRFVIENFVMPIVRNLAALFNSDFAQAVRGIARIVADNIGIAVGKFIEFRDRVNAAFNRLVGIFDGFGANLRDRFVGAVARAIGDVQGFFVRLPGNIRDAVGDLGNLLFGTGRNIILGLVRGITSMIGSLISTARRIADTVSNTISSALDINSPSKVTEKLGEFTGEGFDNGLENTIPAIARTANRLAGAAVPQFALPNGQRLNLAETSADRSINVFIGNEQLNPRIDFRVNTALAERNRVMQTGVRRG